MTKTKDTNYWQFFALIAISGLAIKLFKLPVAFLEYAGRDALLGMLLSLICQAAVFLLVLVALRKAPSISAYELFRRSFGKVAAKIIMTLFSCVLLLNLLFSLVENESVLSGTLYVYLPRAIFNFIVVGLLFYMTRKGLKSIARVAELILPFLLLALFLMYLAMFSNVRFDNALPFFANGVTPVVDSFLKFPMLFGEAIVAVMMLGKIKESKRNFVLGAVSIAVVSFTLASVVLIYICEFSEITTLSRYNFSLPDLLTLNHARNEYTSTLGMVFTLFWSLAALVKMAFYLCLVTTTLAEIWNIRRDFWLLTVLSALMFVLSAFVIPNHDTLRMITLEYLWVAGLIFCYIVPLLVPLALVIQSLKNKRNAKFAAQFEGEGTNEVQND